MTKKKWELNLHQARELRKKGSEILFDRVMLLVSCYEDDGFRTWCADNETDELEYLDEELSDVGFDFITLKAVLAEFPEKESWVKHNIRVLTAQVLKAQREQRADGEKNEHPKYKELYLEMKAENELLRARIEVLEESLGIVAGAKCVS